MIPTMKNQMQKKMEHMIPIMKNRMQKKVEHGMEAGIMYQGLPTMRGTFWGSP